jgi:polyhydroxybutyrate depolymerase
VGAPNTQDDFGFLEAMVTQVDSAQCVDRAHIYVAGFSMGGYFAHHAGCKGPKFVRAIAPHSGGTYSGPCDNGVKPVFIVHGGSDTLIFNSNGEAARSYWVMRNGCSSEVDKMDVKGGSCEWHKGCPAGGQVVKCTFPSMDHGWAGAPCPCGWTSLKYAGGDQYADAAELIWAFFKKNY